jgi:hypothetical protein
VNEGATSAERSDPLDIGGNEEQGVRRHAAKDGVDSSLDVWVCGRSRRVYVLELRKEPVNTRKNSRRRRRHGSGGTLPSEAASRISAGSTQST